MPSGYELVLAVLARHRRGLTRGQALCAAVRELTGADEVVVSLGGDLGVTLILAGTSDPAVRAEQLQVLVGDGPSMEALSGGVPVLVADLAAEPTARWPVHAGAGGVPSLYRAVLCLPLTVAGGAAFGVVSCYRHSRSEWPLVTRGGAAAAERTLGDLTEAVSLAVLELLALDPLLVSGTQRTDPEEEDGLGTDSEVQVAAGVVAEQLGLAVDEAMLLLRARAFADGRTLREVAAAVVQGRCRLKI